MVIAAVGLFNSRDDIHHVLDRPVVGSLSRAAVAAADFAGRQLVVSDLDVDVVIALNIVRRPAEIAGRHESRVADHGELEQQNGRSDDQAQVFHGDYSNTGGLGRVGVSSRASVENSLVSTRQAGGPRYG